MLFSGLKCSVFTGVKTTLIAIQILAIIIYLFIAILLITAIFVVNLNYNQYAENENMYEIRKFIQKIKSSKQWLLQEPQKNIK